KKVFRCVSVHLAKAVGIAALQQPSSATLAPCNEEYLQSVGDLVVSGQWSVLITPFTYVIAE
ncbi:MAG: hypothetical protein PHR20_04360, partial [Bacteroidales bacterium]|nr:hypothetical protein [Bacteroidales bacterium]